MEKSIIIDATHLAGDRPTGVEAYVRGLLPPLSEQLMSAGWKVTWVGHEPASSIGMPAGVEWIVSPHRRFWSQTALTRLLYARKPDLFFTPSGIPPLLYRGATSLTVHDMGAYVDPMAYSPSQLARLRPMLRRAVRHASLVTVPSEFTARQLADFWHKPSVVAYPAYDLPVKLDAEPVAGVREPFLLFVGRLERKKNLITLVRGFAKLEDSTLQLVLAGKDGYGIKALRAEIAKLPVEISNRILLPGYITEGQKKWLYERALAVTVPCLFEGFGIPILEAFAYRSPVICSQSGSLPEVGGDAAVYVQGDIATDWQLQIKKVADDAELRKTMIAKGTQRLKEFSWDNAASSIVTALS